MKLKNLLLCTSMAILAGGCANFKKLKDVQYTVTPDPLEMHADSIAVSVNGSYPKKVIPKKGSAVITPVLEYDGGSVKLKPWKIKGEKSDGEGDVVSNDGGSFSYEDKIAYKDGMQNSELIVTAVGYKKGKEKYKGELDDPIVKGTIITPLLVQNSGQATVAAHGYGPIFKTKDATVYFAYNRYNLKRSERDSLREGSFNAFVEFHYNDSATFKTLKINGYASPDGEMALNSELSDDRAKEVQQYLENYFEDFERIEEFNTTAQGNGEDKALFGQLLAQSDVSNKSAIKSQVNSGATTSGLKKIENSSFEELEENVLSPIRRAEIALTVQQREKTPAELKSLALSGDASILTLKEYLYTAQELLENDADKLKALRRAQTQYDAWQAYNNEGVILLNQGKHNEALTAFQKAEVKAEDEPIVANNIGSVYIAKGDYDKAAEYLKKGVGSGPENNHNLGTFYIKRGKYSEAVSTFGSEKSFNAALANLLAGNASDVEGIIDASAQKDEAISYYLKAIAAARQKDNQNALSNLETAISNDASLKAKAKTDLEFRNLFNNSKFKSLIN